MEPWAESMTSTGQTDEVAEAPLGLLGEGMLEVEGEEPFQDFGVREVRGPTVSGVDGGIEFCRGRVEAM